ncbi:MAG: polysaccharide biosynthesis/export family protein [Hyphomicrobium sp.]
MPKGVALAVAIVGAMMLLGCSQTVLNGQSNATGSTETLTTAAKPTAKLEPADKIRVTIFNEPQLSGEYTVDGSGSIAYPLIGQIPVAGLDAEGVQQRLTERLSGRYLINPKISVDFIDLRPFYIMGEVNKPGEVPYRPGLNAVTAIALAGGFGPRASTSAIMVQRANEKEAKEYPVDPSVLIHPGDVIKVRERMF